MDVLNLLSAAPAANVSQLTGNGGTSGSQAATGGEAVFQKQLMSIISAQPTEATEAQEAAALQSLLLANSATLLAPSEELTEEGLSAIIDQLLDQLDQLEQLTKNDEVELTQEQQSELLSLLQQVTALIELISVSTDSAQSSLLLQSEAVNSSLQLSNANNESIIKLADQLLLLQQTLQGSSNKVLFAQNATVLVHEQLEVIQAKINELLGQVKQKGNEQAADVQQAATAPKEQANAAAHLQRMSQEATYSNVANKVADVNSQSNTQAQAQSISQEATYAAAANQTADTGSNSTATQAPVAEQPQVQTTTVLPEFQLRSDNARDFLVHLAKNSSGAPSAYVLADEFADTMKELIVQRFNISSLNGVTEAKLSLTPEHLGQVDVKISMQNGVLTAVFQAESAMAKDALESQMVQLRASLAQQGITVEKIEVSQSQLASQLNQGQKQGSNNHQQGDDQAHSRHKEDTFEEELLINVTNQELGFGRAVNETV